MGKRIEAFVDRNLLLLHDAEPLVLLKNDRLEASPHILGNLVVKMHLSVVVLHVSNCFEDLIIDLLLPALQGSTV
jgi:hypothetical protein